MVTLPAIIKQNCVSDSNIKKKKFTGGGIKRVLIPSNLNFRSNLT